MDERLSHSPKELAKHPDPLPKDPSCQAGFGHVNKTYVLLKSEADIRRVWKPDVFVDQAVTIRYNWPMISKYFSPSHAVPGLPSSMTCPSLSRCTRTR